MQKQQALTVIGSAIASAAATAALLFASMPAAPPLERTPAADEVAALRREVNALRDELAARPAPLPAPVVAERVADFAEARAHEELGDRCNELVSRCEELERQVAALNERLATTAFNPAGGALWIPTSDDAAQEGDGRVLEFGSIQTRQAAVRTEILDAVTKVEKCEVELPARTFVFTGRL